MRLRDFWNKSKSETLGKSEKDWRDSDFLIKNFGYDKRNLTGQTAFKCRGTFLEKNRGCFGTMNRRRI